MKLYREGEKIGDRKKKNRRGKGGKDKRYETMNGRRGEIEVKEG